MIGKAISNKRVGAGHTDVEHFRKAAFDFFNRDVYLSVIIMAEEAIGKIVSCARTMQCLVQVAGILAFHTMAAEQVNSCTLIGLEAGTVRHVIRSTQAYGNLRFHLGQSLRDRWRQKAAVIAITVQASQVATLYAFILPRLDKADPFCQLFQFPALDGERVGPLANLADCPQNPRV